MISSTIRQIVTDLGQIWRLRLHEINHPESDHREGEAAQTQHVLRQRERLCHHALHSRRKQGIERALDYEDEADRCQKMLDRPQYPISLRP